MSAPTADDVRWVAQKVVADAFHAVSDASVKALAARVLELERVFIAAVSEALELMRAQGERLKATEESLAHVENLACAAAFDAGLAQAAVARSSRDMYAEAWEREIGPPYRQKFHHIDAMVLTTQDRMKELGGLRAALKKLVESYAVRPTKLSASWLSDDSPSTEEAVVGRGKLWRNALDALEVTPP